MNATRSWPAGPSRRPAAGLHEPTASGLDADLADDDRADDDTAEDNAAGPFLMGDRDDTQALTPAGLLADEWAQTAAVGRARAAPVARAPLPEDGQLSAWVEAIADHDERALSALYDASVSRVYGLVLRLVRRPALAEEVVEETYFQVWRQAPRFNPARGRAMTWLLGMARSRAIDAIRREARYQHDSLDCDAATQLCDPGPAADDLLAAARGHADLHRALLQLQAQPRQLVALAFLSGQTHEEIASQTTLPLGTVKSQIRRALLTLRQVLGEQALPLGVT